MRKSFKAVGIMVLAVLALVIGGSLTTANANADKTVNARHQGMVNDGTTSNNDQFQAIIDKYPDTTPVTIHITKGTYLFTKGAAILHSNITFKFDKGAIFKVTDGNRYAFHYPSPALGYDGGISNVHWQGATFVGDHTNGQAVFVQSLNHAQNVTYNGCRFDNAESPTGHYIDIDGSHNIDIQNSTFTGFNGKVDFKEAIQVDYSSLRAMSYRHKGDQYDQLPSYDVTVNKCKFIPLSNKSGLVQSYAPNPIGEHAVYRHGTKGVIHDVYFTNNYVQDPKPLNQDETGTIHFKCVSNLTISGNTFVNKNVVGSRNYIYLWNSEPAYDMKNITISRNKFIDTNPLKQTIFFDVRGGGKISDIDVTNNQVTYTKKKAALWKASDGSVEVTDKKNTFKKAKGQAKPTAVKPSSLVPFVEAKKQHKATNKHEKYWRGDSTQTAQLAKSYKKYSLYNHVRGSKNWGIVNFKWKTVKNPRVYVDMRSEADTGSWYRIRFSSSQKAKRYWIKASALKFDKITDAKVDKQVDVMKIVPLYTRVFNDKLLAKDSGKTTADLPRIGLQVLRRAERITANNTVLVYYQLFNKLWARATAFY